MLFTEGQLHKYERMMQEKPVYDCGHVKTMDKRDCKHCLYFDERCRKCSKKKCTLFND